MEPREFKWDEDGNYDYFVLRGGSDLAQKIFDKNIGKVSLVYQNGLWQLMKKTKIVLIEDEKDLVKLLTYNLEKEGYEVFSALDGEEGLKLVKSKKPQLVILDLMLPKIDGFECCRLIRQDSKTPIIMLTAKREEVDRILGLEMGLMTM